MARCERTFVWWTGLELTTAPLRSSRVLSSAARAGAMADKASSDAAASLTMVFIVSSRLGQEIFLADASSGWRRAHTQPTFTSRILIGRSRVRHRLVKLENIFPNVLPCAGCIRL